MTDSRAMPRSNTNIPLIRTEELGERFDTSSAFTDVTDTGSDMSESFAITSTKSLRSPWMYEPKGSSSSSVVSSTGKTTRNKKRRGSNSSLSCRKTYLSKNSSIKSISSMKNTPRNKRFTGKKNNSKYSWTGTFNERRSRRAMYIDTQMKYLPVDSKTRSSSPVDNEWFYKADSDTEAKVFRLDKNGRSRAPSSWKDQPDFECTINREESYNSMDLNMRIRMVDPNERMKSRLSSARTLSRSPIGSANSTLIANCVSPRRSNVSRFSLGQIGLMDKTIEVNDLSDDEVFVDDVYTTTADLYVSDKLNDNDSIAIAKEIVSVNSEKSGFRFLLRWLSNLIFTVLKNLFLLSLLPTIYVAFFIYVQNRED